MDTAIEDFITRTRGATTINELFTLFERQMEFYGFKHLAYAVVSDYSTLQTDNSVGLILNNDLNRWDEHYLESDYGDVDIIPKIAFTSPGFFTWSDVSSVPSITEAQRNIFRQAEEFKLYNGINISIHVPGGAKCILSAAADHPDFMLTDVIKDKVSLVTQQFNTCFLSLMNYKPDTLKIMSLSIKEEEILKWTAKGLTKSEISQLLNISHHTVNYHMRNVFKKLQAKNTTEALIIAIKQGLAI